MSAKTETSVTDPIARSSAKVRMIETMPMPTGTAAASNPPKMKINTMNVIGIAMASATRRSDAV